METLFESKEDNQFVSVSKVYTLLF